MTNIICLLGDEMSPEIQEQLEQLDGEEVSIHVVTYVMGEEQFIPPMILSAVEEVGWKLTDDLIFCSDLKNLCRIAACIYARIFRTVLWLESNEALEYLIDPFYQSILEYDCSSDFDFTQIGAVHSPGETQFSIYYQIEDTYYIFEPILGDRILITKNGIRQEQPEYNRVCYMYPYLEKELEKFLLADPSAHPEEYRNYIAYSGIKILKKIEDVYSSNSFTFEMFCLGLEDCCYSMEKYKVHLKMIAATYLIAVTRKSRYYDWAYRLVYEDKQSLSTYNKYYLWRQLKRYTLRMPDVIEYQGISGRLYDKICGEYDTLIRKEDEALLQPIPRHERDEECYVVLGIQFLSEMHAPTRTALERCVTLRKLGKKVLFINTREQITTLGVMPICNGETGNVLKEYDTIRKFTYQGYTFDFYQCNDPMPELGEIRKILTKIRKIKPYMIFTLGAGSIVAELASNVIPVLNFPMAFSTFMKRKGQFTSLGRLLTDQEKEQLEREGFPLDSVIEGVFTFDIKQKVKCLSKRELLLPEDKFILTVVGLRLHTEVDDKFISAMAQLYSKGIHLLFAGFFDNYQEKCQNYPELVLNSTYVGYQDDILALHELTDLYVNPMRLGGGFSIAEAFAAGKPGVTIRYGDVAAAAGEAFCVKDYNEMTQQIEHYMTDPDFYKKMVQKAQERLAILTDSTAALQHIIHQAEERTGFF